MGKLRTWAPGDLARMTSDESDEIQNLDRTHPAPTAFFGCVGLVVEVGPVFMLTGEQEVLLDISGRICWATNSDLELLS